MNRSILISAMLATLTLAACDKPTVVTVPATPVAVPGPAGPQGETGSQGSTGYQGATGEQGATYSLISLTLSRRTPWAWEPYC